MSTDFAALSNADPKIAALTAKGHQAFKRGKESGLAALEAHAEGGQVLIELKKHLPNRTFGAYVTTNFGITKPWRCRLTTLGKERFQDVLEAIHWGVDNGLTKRPEYGVDRVLALVAKWHRAQAGESVEDILKSSQVSNKRSKSQNGSDEQNELFRLRSELKEARARICSLEAEVDRLNGSSVETPRTIDTNEAFASQNDEARPTYFAGGA